MKVLEGARKLAIGECTRNVEVNSIGYMIEFDGALEIFTLDGWKRRTRRAFIPLHTFASDRKRSSDEARAELEGKLNAAFRGENLQVYMKGVLKVYDSPEGWSQAWVDVGASRQIQ